MDNYVLYLMVIYASLLWAHHYVSLVKVQVLVANLKDRCAVQLVMEMLFLKISLQNVTLWPIIHILEFWEKSEIQCVYFVLNRGKTAIKVGQFPKFRLLIIKFQVSKNAVFQLFMD